MRKECYFCQVKGVENLIEKSKPDDTVAEDFIFCVHYLLGANRNTENARLSAEVHRLAKQKFNNADLYKNEKNDANDLLMGQYNHWKAMIQESQDPFRTAAKLATIGNIIDYGANSVGDDISKQIEELYLQDLKIDRTEQLESEIKKAKSILYLGDNCGEIVFDKLFIETFKHPNVTFAVRGAPVINDVTIEDAKQVGMEQVCKVVSNGADAPSTLLELCSEEFVDIFYQSDLIISKGQGNFEGLIYNDHPNIFFMLIAKCKPMAELLNVQKFDMVVTDLN